MSSNSAAAALDLQAEPFFYMPAGENGKDENNAAVAWNAPGSPGRASFEQREKEAFERGLTEGEARAHGAYEKELITAKGAISGALEKFKAERDSYFALIEPEVVQLALGMARKILHRE